MPLPGDAHRGVRIFQGLSLVQGEVSSFPSVQRLFCGYRLASLEQKDMLAQLFRAGIRAILLRSPHSCTSPSSDNKKGLEERPTRRD